MWLGVSIFAEMTRLAEERGAFCKRMATLRAAAERLGALRAR